MAARKMMLCPAELVTEFERKEKLATPSVTKIQLALDKEMELILKSDMTEYDKLQRYNDVLQRFLSLHNLNKQDVPTNGTTVLEEPPSQKENPILEHLPSKRFKGNASYILAALEALGNKRIHWDSNGSRVYINNNHVPGANLVDLVHFLLKTNPPKDPPPGFPDFLEALISSTLATTWIPNTKVRLAIEKSRTVPATPQSTTPFTTPVSIEHKQHGTLTLTPPGRKRKRLTEVGTLKWKGFD